MSSQARQYYNQTAIYDTLVDEHEIFEAPMDCFVFAACVGFAEGRHESEDYTGDGEILWMHFGSRDLFRAAAAAIAYQHTDDPTALTDPSTQLEVMAQYAAGGAAFLEEKFGDAKGTPREGLLTYIQSETSEDERDDQNEMLEQIARSFDEEMLSD